MWLTNLTVDEAKTNGVSEKVKDVLLNKPPKASKAGTKPDEYTSLSQVTDLM